MRSRAEQGREARPAASAVLAAVCVPACHEGGGFPVQLLQCQFLHSSGLFILESHISIYYLREVNIYLNGYLLYLYRSSFL